MSNYALKSQLSQLESELRRAENYNAELCSELSTISNGVNQAQRDLEDYNEKIRNTLTDCNNSMQSSHQRVVDSIALQGEIERLYERFKNVELANKKIRAANNKKFYDFANYRTVRKIVQGIMDNLDLQMVSDRTITKSVEVQHLQTPDYWLTCVLISIMAWRNDDKELADRAMDRALHLDKKSSAVFYMLFNLRMGRDEAALKWFNTYQGCELKGSDQRTFLMLFSLISKTIADTVDERTRDEVVLFIKKVIANNIIASDFSEEGIVGKIRTYFDRMQQDELIQYSMLRKCCLETDQLTSVMMQAKNNISILEFILKTVNVPAEEKNTFIKEFIDELIAAPNQAEQEVYDEIAYNEIIIRLEGDVGAANERFSQEQTRKANDLNLIAEMVDWIYEREAEVVNGQMKLNMFTLTKDFQEKAVEEHAADYRSRIKDEYLVKLDEYETLVDFRDEDAEYRKIDDHYTAKRDADIGAVKDFPAYFGFGIAVLALVGCFFAGSWLLIFTLGGLGFGLYKLFANKSKRMQIQKACSESIKTTCEMMRQLFGEYRQYSNELKEYDAYYDRILDELHKI